MTAGYDPAISSAEDASTLEELGYTQELHRGIGGYASFAAGFSFVSILTTVFAFFPLGFALGGPAFFFTWPIVFVCQFCVCLVFAELSGKFPVAADPKNQVEYSVAGRIASGLEVIVRPIGFNHEIALSLIPAMAAREVAVSSLATVYAIEALCGQFERVH